MLGGFVSVVISILIVLLVEKLWFRILLVVIFIIAVTTFAFYIDKKNKALENAKNVIPANQVDLTIHSMSSPFVDRGDSFIKFSVKNNSSDCTLEGIKVYFEIFDCDNNHNMILGKADKYFYTEIPPKKTASFEEIIYFRDTIKPSCNWSSRYMVEYTTGKLHE